jgi:hypothetical protein
VHVILVTLRRYAHLVGAGKEGLLALGRDPPFWKNGTLSVRNGRYRSVRRARDETT